MLIIILIIYNSDNIRLRLTAALHFKKIVYAFQGM